MPKRRDPADRAKAGAPPDVDVDFENGDDMRPNAREPAVASAGAAARTGGPASGRGVEPVARPSRATTAVALARGAKIELWHDPDGEPYADVLRGEARVTLRVRTVAFREWLSGLVYNREGRALGAPAASEAIGALAAAAVHEGETRSIHVRVARAADGAFYLDLGDPTWQAVRVTGDGWMLDPRPPVRFRRPGGMLALSPPVRGDGWADLRRLVRAASERDWRMLVAWLVGTLHAGIQPGPYPILALAGEQGAGKTWTARVLRACVDPSIASVRSPPREPRDLVVAARNNHILAFDNLSSVPQDLSDGFCRIATGGGYGARGLFTDGEEVVFADRRPILLTSIEDVANRADLADRTIMVTLEPLPETERRTESDLQEALSAAQPAILAALLDAVSMGLSRGNTSPPERLPRMADFAAWIMACEPALPWPRGEWLGDYTEARVDGQRVAVEADPVATALINLVEAGEWTGTAAELLETLDARRGSAPPPRSWPTSARGMTGALARAAPLLRSEGVSVTRRRDAGRLRGRLITLAWSTG